MVCYFKNLFQIPLNINGLLVLWAPTKTRLNVVLFNQDAVSLKAVRCVSGRKINFLKILLRNLSQSKIFFVWHLLWRYRHDLKYTSFYLGLAQNFQGVLLANTMEKNWIKWKGHLYLSVPEKASNQPALYGCDCINFTNDMFWNH